MDKKQFQRRVYVVSGVLGLLFFLFVGVLYQLQIIQGPYYRAQATKRNAQTETVEAVRGEILDCNGRVMVSNRSTYQVRLNTSVMGTEEGRNAILTALLQICREQGVTWTDTLPVTGAPPFEYTLGTATGTNRRAFLKLMDILSENNSSWETASASGVALGEEWEAYRKAVDAASQTTETGTQAAETPAAPEDTVSAAPLIAKMKDYFGIDPTMPDEEVRDLIGVLYELTLRSKGAATSEYIFAQDVDIRFITAVKEQGLKGVKIEPTTTRVYETSYAAHILGRVGPIFAEEWNEEDSYYKNNGYKMDDIVGKEGMEKAFESYLRGEEGTQIVELNSEGKVVSETWKTDPETGEPMAPKPGNNVVTTIDLRLQEALEQSLATRVPGLSDTVEGAAGVVIDMKGGVKAIASYPTFDISQAYKDSSLYNELLKDPLRPLYNRATMGLYSPGSTFKMITGVAALQEGLTTPYEEILDTGYFRYPEGEKYPYGDYHPKCWIYRQQGGTHGWEDMAHAIEDSCNVFFFTLADRLGIDLLDEYAAMFGLGQSTGIEVPEYTGYVAGPETSERLNQEWYGGLLLSAAIGQGNTLCTPLQLANYIATLVNGGNHYPAHLLQTVKSSDYSQVVLENEPEPLDTINISEENLEAVKYGMYLLGTEGSVSKYFKDLPVEVGAKTGTAQVGSETTEANAVFVCFAPYDDPEIAIALVAEHGDSGGGLAAVAADVLSVYFGQSGTSQAVNGEGVLIR